MLPREVNLEEIVMQETIVWKVSYGVHPIGSTNIASLRLQLDFLAR